MTKMLSAHPKALVISDPYVYFFKGYRNFHYARAGIVGFDPTGPMSDHFMDSHHDVLRRIIDSDLSETIPQNTKKQIREAIREWKLQQHSDLCRRLDEADGKTFAEFYDSLIWLLKDIYGSAETEQVGTKVSWSEEYLLPLARAFPDMKFIFVVRDLRAIVSSQNNKKGPGAGKRPLLFYIRNWRKSVAFGTILTRILDDVRDRILFLRYEDMIADPESVARKCSAHLGLHFDPAMNDQNRYRNEASGAAWSANTSYQGEAGIVRPSIDAWKERLSEAETRCIEALAGPELTLMGYDLTCPDENSIEPFLLDGTPEPEFEELADFIKASDCARYVTDQNLMKLELEKEIRRRAILRGNSGTIDEAEAKQMFIEPAYLRVLSEFEPHTDRYR